MSALPVIAVFDVGKTNKKLFLFDESYQIVHEKSTGLEETIDEEGFPCEQLNELSKWVLDSVEEISDLKQFQIKAVHFSAYGASLVYVDNEGNSLTPLYNYLKPLPCFTCRSVLFGIWPTGKIQSGDGFSGSGQPEFGITTLSF